MRDTRNEQGLSRMWADSPPAGDDRAAELLAAGAGRRQLSRELGITEHKGACCWSAGATGGRCIT